MSQAVETLAVPFRNTFHCPVQIYPGPGDARTLLVLPAMGVAARHYQAFATRLQQQGLNVLVPEWPGQASSHPRPDRRHDYGYRALLTEYLPALLRLANARFPDSGKAVLVGHSLGGQLGTLYLAHRATDAGARLPEADLFGIACGNIHYRHWQGRQRLFTPMAALGFNLITLLLGYLPGHRIGFGGHEPPQLIRDWGRVAWRGNFRHIGLPLAEPVPGARASYLGFQGDHYAPPASTRALADQLGPPVPMHHLPAIGNPHSGWLKAPEPVVTALSDWLGGLLTDS